MIKKGGAVNVAENVAESTLKSTQKGTPKRSRKRNRKCNRRRPAPSQPVEQILFVFAGKQVGGLIIYNAIAETPLVPKGRQPLGRGVNPCAMDTWRVVASERRHNFTVV